jgi:hypothetical protein
MADGRCSPHLLRTNVARFGARAGGRMMEPVADPRSWPEADPNWSVTKELLFQWVVVSGPRIPLEDVGAWTHLVGYVYIDDTAGVTLDVALACTRDGRGRLHAVGDLRALGQSWKVRYLPFAEPRILSAEEVRRLGLPETPDWLHFYGGKKLAPLLQYEVLDPLRARGFPHDILVLLISDDLSPEGVWLRMDEVVRENPRPAVKDAAHDRPQELLWVRGTLLNDPHQNFGFMRATC